MTNGSESEKAHKHAPTLVSCLLSGKILVHGLLRKTAFRTRCVLILFVKKARRDFFHFVSLGIVTVNR